LFREAVAVSVVLPVMLTVIDPWCVPALMASNASLRVG
jgi:hypothetical protein